MANKEKTVEGYIVSRLKHLIETAVGFDKHLQKEHETLQTDQLALKKMKKDNPDKTAVDFKEQILDLNKRFYSLSMLEQNLKNVACAIAEIQLIVKVGEYEMDLSKDEEEIYSMLSTDNRDLFLVENGKVKPVDEEMYADIESKMIARASREESLEDNFKLI